MSRSYLELIAAWEDFLKETPQGSLAEFGEWLLQQTAILPSVGLADAPKTKQEETPNTAYIVEQQQKFGYSLTNARVPQLIWKLHKILRYYSKPIFDRVGLNNQDEFALLAQVHFQKECSKKEAITANLMDRSTGIDMIKRLLKRGLLLDRVDPNDGRARLVRLSEKGEQLLYQIYSEFTTIPELLVNMSEQEQEYLITTLQRLERWHSTHL